MMTCMLGTILVTVVVTTLLLALLAGGVWWYLRRHKNAERMDQPTGLAVLHLQFARAEIDRDIYIARRMVLEQN